MSAISIINAKKSYGALEALKGIHLEVKKGEFFGLLGPNGAGKTTLIQCIVGLSKLTGGSIRVYGHDTRRDAIKAKALVGFSPQEVNLDRFFPVRRILMYQGGFFGLSSKDQKKCADDLLEKFDLTEKANMPYYKLSGGMQKRLLIAKAVIGKPQVLILDEPTAGVDVEQRHRLWKYLKRLNEEGTTIILTTHYIDEAQALCGRIGIIHLGAIREIGSPQDLIERYCIKKVTFETSCSLDPGLLQKAPFSITVEGHYVTAIGNHVGIILDTFHREISKIPGCRIVDLSVDRGSLEEVFIKLAGTSLGTAEKEEIQKPEPYEY